MERHIHTLTVKILLIFELCVFIKREYEETNPHSYCGEALHIRVVCVHIVRVRSDIFTLLLWRNSSYTSCVCSYSESTERHIHTLIVEKLFRCELCVLI